MSENWRPLRWVRDLPEQVWHLSWDGFDTICGRSRPGHLEYALQLTLAEGPPTDLPPHSYCQTVIAHQLDLDLQTKGAHR